MQTIDPAGLPETIRYGADDARVGDLYLPTTSCPPVVCLLHGGFWRMPYGREEFAAVAVDLAARGYAVWNIEYRRVGAPGGGWPGTLTDVAAALDHLAILQDAGVTIDLRRVVVVGHSAGGHLALWVSALNRPTQFPTPARIRPLAAAGLAPVADLAGAEALGLGQGAVGEFLNGTPQQFPDRYAAAAPLSLLPLGVAQLIVHGGQDTALPVALSRRYVAAARAAGDRVDFVELPDAGHMDFLDPSSTAHAKLCAWLARVTGQAGASSHMNDATADKVDLTLAERHMLSRIVNEESAGYLVFELAYLLPALALVLIGLWYSANAAFVCAFTVVGTFRVWQMRSDRSNGPLLKSAVRKLCATAGVFPPNSST